MEFAEVFFRAAEWVGTVAFAVSAAMIAIDRKLDLFGIILLSIVTSVGGGTMRDMLLGQFPPKMFFHYEYVLIATVCALVVFFFARVDRNQYSRVRERLAHYINVIDAIGLGIFAVIGVEAGILAGYGGNAFMCIFLGMTTCIGGGILRDVMSQAVPFVLCKRVYALAAILGGCTYYVMALGGIQQSVSMFCGMSVTVIIRLLAAHYRWSLPKAYEEE